MLELTADGPHVDEAEAWLHDLERCEWCFALTERQSVYRHPVADDPDRAMWVCARCEGGIDVERRPEIPGLPAQT